MAQRIQLDRFGQWRLEYPGAINVSRGSVWGNPFRGSVYGRELAAALYRDAVAGNWNPSLLDQSRPDSYWDETYELARRFRQRLGGGNLRGYAISALRGRDLACWCEPDEICHADVLLEIANPKGAHV